MRGDGRMTWGGTPGTFLLCLAAVLVVGVVGCRRREGTGLSPWKDYSEKVREALEVEASRVAAEAETGLGRYAVTIQFIRGYHDELTEVCADATDFFGRDVPGPAGYEAGKALARKERGAGATRLTLEDFGYEVVTAEGTCEGEDRWQLEFHPAGSAETWYLYFQKNCTGRETVDSGASREWGRKFRLTGYAAPLGRDYTRVVIVSEMVAVLLAMM